MNQQHPFRMASFPGRQVQSELKLYLAQASILDHDILDAYWLSMMADATSCQKDMVTKIAEEKSYLHKMH